MEAEKKSQRTKRKTPRRQLGGKVIWETPISDLRFVIATHGGSSPIEVQYRNRAGCWDRLQFIGIGEWRAVNANLEALFSFVRRRGKR